MASAPLVLQLGHLPLEISMESYLVNFHHELLPCSTQRTIRLHCSSHAPTFPTILQLGRYDLLLNIRSICVTRGVPL